LRYGVDDRQQAHVLLGKQDSLAYYILYIGSSGAPRALMIGGLPGPPAGNQ
jgi:hypothetical protein